MQSQTSEEVHRQGDFLRIPQIGSSSAIAYLVVNCVIPGLGTVISSWTDVEYPGWDWAVFITGILQFGLAWIIIGWAWSIWWGVRMLQDAQARKTREQQLASVVVPSSIDSSEPSHVKSTCISNATNMNHSSEIPEANSIQQESSLSQNITADNSIDNNQEPV